MPSVNSVMCLETFLQKFMPSRRRRFLLRLVESCADLRYTRTIRVVLLCNEIKSVSLLNFAKPNVPFVSANFPCNTYMT